MPRIPVTALALALALALGAGSPAWARRPAPAPSFFPFEVHQRKLPNGLVAIVIPMRGSGLASVRTAVRTGSRDEYEPGRSGFAHFFEHMMFRGTKKYSADERERVVTRMGASNNAFTSNDMTVYEFDIAAEDLEKVMDLESDRFMNLAYSAEQFQTEAGAVYGEYRKNRANPFFQLFEKISETAFVKHTYGHTTMGYERDIAAMPKMLDYSKQFFSRYYRPENAVLLVIGDVEPDATLAMIEKYWAPWKRGYTSPKVPAEPAQNAERQVQIAYEGRALPILSLAYKAGAMAPRDVGWVSQLVLSELAFGETSEVYKALVLDQRLVQRLFASPANDRDPGLFTVTAVVNDETKLGEVQAALEAAIAKAKAELASPERVAAVAANLRNSFLLKLDTPSSVADQLAPIAAVTGGIAAIEEIYTTLAKVTPQTVQTAARRLFDTRRRTVATLREKKS
ncbi:MAG: pitrilysin family protein [Kofleriaceae bacterium]